MIKRMVILLLLMISASIILAQVRGIQENMTIREISKATNIPVRKIIEYLNLPPDTQIDKTAAELNCTKNDLFRSIAKYQNTKKKYYFGIVLVGMGTVFISLILVALIIGQLKYLDKKKRKKVISIPTYSTTGLDTSEEDDIVAAIVTSIYLYELEVEENNRLMLTWKRAPISMWKASRLVPMNEVDPSRRK